jgi:hypothetical protein
MLALLQKILEECETNRNTREFLRIDACSSSEKMLSLGAKSSRPVRPGFNLGCWITGGSRVATRMVCDILNVGPSRSECVAVP